MLICDLVNLEEVREEWVSLLRTK
ncbi:hypothetical protein Golax_000750 [Gossypium laxum]|uniref:Uncharacterized protein n=1 Tax=Gossypium laxum TaxID=34288 RepID=A0A7J9AWM4_9ROSI|nr:hypothetical protein [Gossypium laxum]